MNRTALFLTLLSLLSNSPLSIAQTKLMPSTTLLATPEIKHRKKAFYLVCMAGYYEETTGYYHHHASARLPER